MRVEFASNDIYIYPKKIMLTCQLNRVEYPSIYGSPYGKTSVEVGVIRVNKDHASVPLQKKKNEGRRLHRCINICNTTWCMSATKNPTVESDPLATMQQYTVFRSLGVPQNRGIFVTQVIPMEAFRSSRNCY